MDINFFFPIIILFFGTTIKFYAEEKGIVVYLLYNPVNLSWSWLLPMNYSNIGTHHEAVVVHVENDVLAHNGQADQCDICPASKSKVRLNTVK